MGAIGRATDTIQARKESLDRLAIWRDAMANENNLRFQLEAARHLADTTGKWPDELEDEGAEMKKIGDAKRQVRNAVWGATVALFDYLEAVGEAERAVLSADAPMARRVVELERESAQRWEDGIKYAFTTF